MYSIHGKNDVSDVYIVYIWTKNTGYIPDVFFMWNNIYYSNEFPNLHMSIVNLSWLELSGIMI